MARSNYLIGRGELLVESIGAPRRRPSKAHPYEVHEAAARLLPQLHEVIDSFPQSSAASPDDVEVVKFALHPAYIAKSYYPDELFASLGLEAVGSRDLKIRPEKHTRNDDESTVYGTSEIFVAGRRSSFLSFANEIADPRNVSSKLVELREIEQIATFDPHEKTKGELEDGADSVELELVLHLPSSRLAPNNRSRFLEYARSLGFQPRADLGFEVRGLWFIPATGPAASIESLAAYTTVRVVRPMPTLSVGPAPRLISSVDLPARLSPLPALSDAPRVAILDGGLPPEHPLGPWISSYREMNPAAKNESGYEQHGLAVASAFLFGPMDPDVEASQPPASVSVFRVLDSSTAEENSFELYRTLGHVEEVLLSRSFDFINLSLGPTLPIEDDEVHAWTALIDDLLSDGDTLMTVAVGNNGERDRESGNARIQVPGDAVNALTVGSSGTSGSSWERAPYSAIGPGRSPGLVKPDIVARGGVSSEYFHVLGEGHDPVLLPSMGTSLSAPFALRQAVMIRSFLGDELSPLAIRALLIHSAERGERSISDVGWGRIPETIQDIVATDEGVARIVYQGELKPGKYVRAKVPMPELGLKGDVKLSATFCFATPVDTQSPDVYTRAGLEVRFRPKGLTIKPGKSTADSRSFFSPSAYAEESTLRSDEGKWETVLSATDTMRGKTLTFPVFDIHYNAREEGGNSRVTDALKYALVITVEAPKHNDLYTEVLDAYPGILVPIEPEIEIDVDV